MGNGDRMGPVDQLWKPTKTRNRGRHPTTFFMEKMPRAMETSGLCDK